MRSPTLRGNASTSLVFGLILRTQTLPLLRATKRAAGNFPAPPRREGSDFAQELAVSAPIQSGVALANGKFEESVTIDPYAITAYWITPHIPDRPADPTWIEASAEDGNVILRWRPNTEPYFYSYEVYVLVAGTPPEMPLSPMPLRSAMWVDTAPPPGTRTYAVRALSASSIRSNLVKSSPVTIGSR